MTRKDAILEARQWANKWAMDYAAVDLGGGFFDFMLLGDEADRMGKRVVRVVGPDAS